MTESVTTGDATAPLLLDAADRLISDLADAAPALGAVGDALAVLADGLGVDKVIVAVDDQQLGRQVFCSGRSPLGTRGVGLRGPQGAWTQPPRPLDPVGTAILLRTVGISVKRSVAGTSRRLVAPAATTNTVAEAVAGATARALRHGWGFTLVLVRAVGDERSDGLAAGLKARLRAADELVVGDQNEIALLLPQTAGDRVPLVLARLAGTGALPPFSYGLACCPADGTDAARLYGTAAERLAAAIHAASAATA